MTCVGRKPQNAWLQEPLAKKPLLGGTLLATILSPSNDKSLLAMFYSRCDVIHVNSYNISYEKQIFRTTYK